MEDIVKRAAFENRCKREKKLVVDIEFQDLSYKVRGADEKWILKSISGKFYSQELTAIMGASGSGKTTLLNVLAGYITNGATGSIIVNGIPRKMKTFRKISAYIMQEDRLQPQLTVHELMMIAARLKLGDNVSLEDKRQTMKKLLNLLGLANCAEIRTERLSGGQRKRLSIALEMVSNPPVIFLDEPTSGLDAVSIKQCIELLKTLTGEGRTVICTIHQPSTSILNNFDQLYFLHDGRCIYNGLTSNILPFMAFAGFNCPVTYNPAEYIIELVQTVPAAAPVLVQNVNDVKVNSRNVKPTSSSRNYSSNGALIKIYEETTQIRETKLDIDFPTSFSSQCCILISRMILQMKRNKTVIWIQCFHHIIGGLLHGLLFYRIGNNASVAFANVHYSFCVLVFFLFTHLMSNVLLFPSEVELIQREYFNRWYSLKSYFLVLTLRNIPIKLFLGMVFICSSYLLSDQPFEIQRFLSFSLVNILVAEATEAMALAIGSLFNVTDGSIIAPALAAPLLLITVYGVGYGSTIGTFMTILTYTSYLRWAFIASLQSVLGNRDPFDCAEESLCYYRYPKHVLQDLGMVNASYNLHVLGLFVFVLLFRLIAFLALRIRLNPERFSIITSYINKMLKYR